MIIESFDNRAPQIDPTAFVARGAALVGELTLGPHSSVWYNATLRADLAAIRIGAYSNVQDNACIHVEAGGACTVGAHVTIGHCATLHACTVEDDVLIGMGAIVLDGAVIGRGSIVGAHALVTKNTQVPPYSLVLGSPAKVVRTLPESVAQDNHRHAEEYAELAARYAAR
ncbi:MAG: gamma carbonic anhydrase family protein [Akkermansia sp.]|nr:gamma carbonic anhydrase family protein [Akkermansia sp.]